MSSHGSHGMPRYMCDDILRGSPYGLDFSVMAKARVIVAPPVLTINRAGLVL